MIRFLILSSCTLHQTSGMVALSAPGNKVQGRSSSSIMRHIEELSSYHMNTKDTRDLKQTGRQVSISQPFDVITSIVLGENENVVQLQAATGTEVADMELHLQMEAARRRSVSTDVAEAFISSHVKDASPGEKFAMKMIPMQLPSPAVKLSSTKVHESNKTTGRKRTIQKRRRSNQGGKAARMSQEEEYELGVLIRQGARLNNIKDEFEKVHNREISRAEWTECAGLASPSVLRRLISQYRKAKNKLVTANMGLVYAVVRQNSYLRTRSEEEAVQEGSLGLMRAAELFDPERGLRFSTYATIWIKGVLGNSNFDQMITVPVREKNKYRKIQKAVSLHVQEGGNLTLSDVTTIGAEVNLKPEDVEETLNRMAQAKNVLSLDYKYRGTTRGGATDSLATLYGDKSLQCEDELCETMQLKADIVATLARNLDPREARLMRLRYGLKDGKSRTMRECAEAMGLSRQRVQQLSAQCLKKLREADDAKSLQEYLLTVA